MKHIIQQIQNGETVLGIELGSTRIKAVLIDKQGNILAYGGFTWENHFEDGIWTYPESEIWNGIQQAYQILFHQVEMQYGCKLKNLSAIGVSAMMHGYMPFDASGHLLVPFRTWRNNITSTAAEKLSELFQFNIPQRWSIAHLYQAMLNQESHLTKLDFLTTLAGYVHWKLTGEKVLGIGDASGMFPVDQHTHHYDKNMLGKFNQLAEPQRYDWLLSEVLPDVLVAGQCAGKLTEEGAKRLDLTGNLQAGIPFCPPEGDAGTGMVATNSVKVKTGNISAGTSAFAMVVLEKALSRHYAELDVVTTPTGLPVAMAHANNCTTEINVWLQFFQQVLLAFGVTPTTEQLYTTLFSQARQGEPDAGGLLPYGFHSGEHSIGLSYGCPLFIHPTQAKLSLPNFMLAQLYSAFGAMKIGMDILFEKEKVLVKQILGHGGIFKTEGVASGILASALNVPVATMKTAGEGGAWGIALLANYLNEAEHHSLESYLDFQIFNQVELNVVQPNVEQAVGYQQFFANYQRAIPVVQQAIAALSK